MIAGRQMKVEELIENSSTVDAIMFEVSPILEDLNFYYLVNDGIEYPIEKWICRDIVNSNKLNSEINLILQNM